MALNPKQTNVRVIKSLDNVVGIHKNHLEDDCPN